MTNNKAPKGWDTITTSIETILPRIKEILLRDERTQVLAPSGVRVSEAHLRGIVDRSLHAWGVEPEGGESVELLAFSLRFGGLLIVVGAACSPAATLADVDDAMYHAWLEIGQAIGHEGHEDDEPDVELI